MESNQRPDVDTRTDSDQSSVRTCVRHTSGKVETAVADRPARRSPAMPLLALPSCEPRPASPLPERLS